MNTPEFIRLKQLNRNLRFEYKKLIELSNKQFEIASKRKKIIKHILKDTYIFKDKIMLESELSEIYDEYLDTIWKADCIEVQIKNNGTLMLQLKGKQNGFIKSN